MELAHVTRATTLIPQSGAVIVEGAERNWARGTLRTAWARRSKRRILEWQRANDDWPNSMALVSRRRACRSRCCARTKAGLINYRSLATTSTASGAITNPAAPWRRWWSPGACQLLPIPIDDEPGNMPSGYDPGVSASVFSFANERAAFAQTITES